MNQDLLCESLGLHLFGTGLMCGCRAISKHFPLPSLKNSDLVCPPCDTH
jgi:hypothetical protein